MAIFEQKGNDFLLKQAKHYTNTITDHGIGFGG